MINISAFPKIFALGTDYIKDIFKGDIEITEKLDGSQFIFGKIEGELQMRSKGQKIYPESCQKMFEGAVEYVTSIEDKIPDNTVLYCEYIQKPKHNTLTYGKTPKNYLSVFAVSDELKNFNQSREEIEKIADLLGIDAIPLIWSGPGGEMANVDKVKALIDKESSLGGCEMEGVVVKNYNQPFLLGGQPIALMSGKFVSEKFKEVHYAKWGGENTSRGKWQTFKDGFKTEARWRKAVEHLRDAGELENTPRDIGKLIKEVKTDIEQEEIDNIKNFLWKEFGSELLRFASGGLPEWYKEEILRNSFDEE